MRVVLDTNVLVGAFASRGLCAELFELVLLDHDMIVGNAVLHELGKALRSKVRLSAARSAEIVEFVAAEAVEVAARAVPVDAAVDPADALVLGEALAARADIFVTGDAALVRLSSVGGLDIVTPRRFWEILRAA